MFTIINEFSSNFQMKSQEVDLALEEAEKAGEEQAKTGKKAW